MNIDWNAAVRILYVSAVRRMHPVEKNDILDIEMFVKKKEL